MYMNQTEQKLVEQHLPIVKKIVLGTIQLNESVQGLGYEDLYQTGCEALCHAAMHYRDDRGASFETFATVVIKNRLLSHCRSTNRIQYPLEYLESPMNGCTEHTYGDTLAREAIGYAEAEDKQIVNLLYEARHDYAGITQKGIHSLILKCLGHSGIEIATYYNVKPNHVAAWITRAGTKLRTDKRFSCLQP